MAERQLLLVGQHLARPPAEIHNLRRGKKSVLREHVILPKAGHSRLTMEFVQDNLEPAYNIAYSGRNTQSFNNKIFISPKIRK